MNCFSQRIKELRLESGYTTKALAEKLGVTVRLIYYWESGKRECSFDMLIKIANLFNTTVDYLIGRTD
ncbi:MAG: helix-turn-helix domain-containing protein [Clostridia bacterium]|nr:helix-turn-helix domain-containing protein [Clostridia bacterium]